MKLISLILVCSLTLWFVPTATTQSLKPAVSAPKAMLNVARPLTKTELQWVQSTLKRMTVAEKVGQLFLADAYITYWQRESDAYKQIQHQIETNKVGGVLVFRSEVWPTAVLTNRWQQMAKTPLLISSDLEMGMGMRFDDTPWWVPNMAVAATGDLKWANLHGAATAKQARAMGVNWLYAPAVDVNNNPDNPVINTRSYGEDPAAVAQFAQAFIAGAHAGGALTCAKHFPGHGDTATDSHIGLPVVDVPKARLDQLELVPFRAAIQAGVSSIMSAHIALPQLETELAAPVRAINESEAANAEFVSQTEENRTRITLPGTLSPKILTGLLREELKFNGIIVTDAMNMAGVASRYTPAEAAIRAIKAGADLIIKSPDIDAAIAGVKAAVTSGEITEVRLNQSVERLLRAKAALNLPKQKLIELDNVDRVINAPEFNQVAQQIADASLTLARDYQKLFPLKLNAQSRVFQLTFTDEDDGNILKPFADELRERVPGAMTFVLQRNATAAQIEQVLTKLDAGKFDAVLFAVAVRARSGKGSVALPPVGKRLAEELVKRHMTTRLPVITISFGNPYLVQAMPNTPSYLLAWSLFPVSQRAVLKALSGEIGIHGKLPVTIPGLFERGSGLQIDTPAK